MAEQPRFAVLRLNATLVPVTGAERQALAQLGARVTEREGLDDEEIAAAGREADAVMVVAACLRGPVIRQLHKCRIISRLGTGVDKIDVAQATQQGIIVTNVPDFCTEEVADHTLALLLSAARRIAFFDRQIRQGRRPGHGEVELHRLAAQTVGLVGFGRIGQAVARRCRGFGLRILATDPRLTPELAREHGVVAADLQTVLRVSDYLCLLCPLLPSTRGLIGRDQLRQMKRSAVLVNTARGELVDEEALAAALREGVIGFAALDVFGSINVFHPDGFRSDHPLFSLPNVLLTPHVAANSVQAGVCCVQQGVEAVVDVLAGCWPRHPVNPQVVPRFPLRRRSGGGA